MICKGCGTELQTDQIYCPQCGLKNDLVTYEDITKQCANCGKRFTEGNHYCDYCGNKLHHLQPDVIQVGMDGMKMPPNPEYQNQMPNWQPNQMQEWIPPYMGTMNQVPPYMQGAPSNQNQGKKKYLIPALVIGVSVAIIGLLIFVGVQAVSIINRVQNSQDINASLGDEYTNPTSPYYYENYTNYIYGREAQAFNSGEDITLENGMMLNFQQTTIEDMGDGTAEVDCNIDLGAMTNGLNLYADDFFIMAYDSDGNPLSDASQIEYVTDGFGNDLQSPYELTYGSYENLMLIFYVPNNTAYVEIYATNLDQNGNEMGPVYYTGVSQ